MTDENSRNPGNSSGRIVRLNEIASLEDRGDLTARIFDELTIEGASAQQALFAGTLFRKSIVRRCNMQRSDFEGAAFEDCLFQDCDFSVADFRSVDAARTRFVRCKFNEGAIRASNFTECSFDRCEFMLQNFELNRLGRCQLNDCLFERSTVLHCHFDQVNFSNTDLADCTAQFHIFDNCTFSQSKFNAEAIGLTFGLTFENLSTIQLLWRGEELPKPGLDEELVSDLAVTYQARGWAFATAILGLNFSSIGRVVAFSNILDVLGRSLLSSRPILGDEIAFLSQIVNKLSERGKLPFVAVVRGLELCVAAAERSTKNDQLLRPLYHAFKDAEYLELDILEQTMSALSQSAPTLTARFVFEEEPSISFKQWLDELSALGVVSGPPPQFRGAAAGSYVEIFYLTAGTLASILICLGLVERIIDRLIYIRARGSILASAKLPPATRRRALQPIAPPSQALSRELQSYLAYASGPHASRIADDAEIFARSIRHVEVADDNG